MKTSTKKYFVLVLTILTVSCVNKDIREREKVECFKEIETKLLSQSIKKLDLDSIVSCIEWDSAMFASRGYYKNYLDYNYEIIDREFKGKKRALNFFDEDRHWFYIYFFHKGDIKSDALAISNRTVHPLCVTLNNSLEMIPRQEMKFNILTQADSSNLKCVSNFPTLVFDRD